MNDKLIQCNSHKYWDAPFNPVVGCRKISEGCENCYAESVCNQYCMNGEAGFMPTIKPNAKPPKKGVVFVGNMTDLFGEWNSEQQITEWLYSLSPLAVNLVLTKRPLWMRKIVADEWCREKRNAGWRKNIIFGTTAENQREYNHRIGDIRAISPVFRTWLSAEPLLGPIDLGLGYIAPEDLPFEWVVVGAESGPKRRPCKLEWIESIVEQCDIRGVPVFVKQLDINGRLEKDISKFPKHLQIRQVPWAK